MRPGMRARAPARADGGTEYRAPPSVWGVDSLKGWMCPGLQFGTGPNQNKWGNLHSHGGFVTTTAPATSMAYTSMGDTSTGKRVVINGTISGTTLTVNSITSGVQSDIQPNMSIVYAAWNADGTKGTPYIVSGTYPTYTIAANPSPTNATSVTMYIIDRWLCVDGQPSFARVADPVSPGRYAYKHRLIFEDYRPAGQGETTTGLKKSITRFGDAGSEPSEGQGTLQPVGTYYMDMFAYLIPAATRTLMLTNRNTLIWQHKNSIGSPGLSIYIAPGKAQIGPSTIPAGERMPTAGNFEPRFAMSGYGNDGDGFGDGFQWEKSIVPNFPAGTWIYLLVRVKPHYLQSSGPHTQVWAAVGNAAAAKVLDIDKPNLDNAAVDVFRQFGWYVGGQNSSIDRTTGANIWPAEQQWWFPGDEIELLMKDYLVAPQWRADAEPPLWLVDQWFNEMRSR